MSKSIFNYKELKSWDFIIPIGMAVSGVIVFTVALSLVIQYRDKQVADLKSDLTGKYCESLGLNSFNNPPIECARYYMEQ